jgi:hypothetical protein
MVKENEDFQLFQSEFKKWQQKFGLTGYKVYFKYEPIDDGFASLSVDSNSMVVSATLNSELPQELEQYKRIEQSAKHEAIHLLTNRLESLANTRFINHDEIYMASEELVFKLEDLIV